MHAKVAAGILLALGAADLAGQNLILVPHLPRRGAVSAALAPMVLRRELRPRSLRAPDGPGPAAPVVVRTASLETVSPSAGAGSAPSPAASDIPFSFGSVRIEQREALVELGRVLRELAADPGRRLVLRGHSDPLGTAAGNLDLSWRRGVAVKQYLVWRGAPSERITIEALGDTEPADPGRTPAAWASDRRVEILWR